MNNQSASLPPNNIFKSNKAFDDKSSRIQVDSVSHRGTIEEDERPLGEPLLEIPNLEKIGRNASVFSAASNLSVTYLKMGATQRTIKIYTGDEDLTSAPPSTNILHWSLFNSDVYALDREFSSVENIAE